MVLLYLWSWNVTHVGSNGWCATVSCNFHNNFFCSLFAWHCLPAKPQNSVSTILYTVCPTRYRTRHFFNNFTTNEDIATKSEARTTDTFFFISATTNVIHFKLRCNIFIGVRIIKEIPGSVASGTHCIRRVLTYCCYSSVYLRRYRLSRGKISGL